MIRVGISGWRYAPWRGVFYPEGLPQRRELEYCGRHFPTVEINGSFYSLQRPEFYRAWREATPPDFVFAVKGSRYITHLRRLRDVEQPLANFYASGLLELHAKLGPLLWQLPPTFKYEPGRLAAFLELLPRSTAAALRLARKRDARMTGRSRLAIDADRPLRHAVEVRHPSFVQEGFVRLLREHDIGLVVADTAGRWPRMFHVTSDFVYVRLHGEMKIYTSGYTGRALAAWARRIRAWAKAGRDVYVYFDNDTKVRAPYDALELMDKLGLEWGASGYRPAPSRTRRAGTRARRSTAAYASRAQGGSASPGAGRR